MFIFGALINKNAMKKRLLFTMLAAVAVLLSCSKTNEPFDDVLLDDQTRSESMQNDSIIESGLVSTVEPWIVNIIDTLFATEIPKDDIDSDTISNDTIPCDTIPKDRITKNSFGVK